MSSPESRPQHSREALKMLPWVVAVALLMENLDATIINTAVPVMAENLGTDPLSLKGVLTSYALSLAVFIPIAGWMSDRFGSKKVFFLAIVIFLVGSILCGLSVNVPMLVVSRILQGIGGAMMTPVGRLVLVRSFPRSDLIRIMNYVVIPAMIGPLIGPFLGGLIVQVGSWRTIFFINVPISMFGLWLVVHHMPNYISPNTPKLDVLGFLLFGSGIGLLCYTLEVLGEHALPWTIVSGLLLLSILLITAYFLHSRKVKFPVLAMHLFKVRTFRISVVGGFVTRLGMSGMPFMLPLLYQVALGFKPWQAGLMTMPQALAALTTKLFNQKILSLFGHRNVLVVNTVLIGMTIMSFSLISEKTPIPHMVFMSFLQGTFASMQFTSMNTLAYADISDADASKASSITSTGQQLSISFGVTFASLVASIFLLTPTGIHPVITLAALHSTFLTIGGLTIVSSLLFWKLKNNDGNLISNRVMPPPHRLTQESTTDTRSN